MLPQLTAPIRVDDVAFTTHTDPVVRPRCGCHAITARLPNHARAKNPGGRPRPPARFASKRLQPSTSLDRPPGVWAKARTHALSAPAESSSLTPPTATMGQLRRRRLLHRCSATPGTSSRFQRQAQARGEVRDARRPSRPLLQQPPDRSSSRSPVGDQCLRIAAILHPSRPAPHSARRAFARGRMRSLVAAPIPGDPAARFVAFAIAPTGVDRGREAIVAAPDAARLLPARSTRAVAAFETTPGGREHASGPGAADASFR